MKNNIFNEDFIEFLTALNEAGVAYILVGGYSVILYGYHRTTGDLDIWVDPTGDNYIRLKRAFSIFQMPVFDMSEEKFLSDKYDVFTFGRTPVSIDIMTQVKGLNFKECFDAAPIHEVDQISVRVLHLQHLIQSKKASGRYKDLDDIQHLEKVER